MTIVYAQPHNCIDVKQYNKHITTCNKLHEEFNKSKTTIRVIENKITKWEKYINAGTISLFVIFATIIGGLFGIEAFRIYTLRKNKEKEINVLLNSLGQTFESDKQKYEGMIREYNTRIITLSEDYERKINIIKYEATQKINASVEKADIEIRKYQDEINKLIDQIKNSSDNDTSEPQSSDDPF